MRAFRKQTLLPTLVQSSLWTGWEISIFSLRQHRGVGSEEDLGSAHGLPLAMSFMQKSDMY